jgi:hypothetical protein
MTLEGYQASVIIENNVTERFNINVGVRHGDALSFSLFNLVLDYIIEKLDIRGNVSATIAHINACADEVIIIYGNLKALDKASQELDNTAQ